MENLAKKTHFQYFREYGGKDSWAVLLCRSKCLKMTWKTEKGKNRKQTSWNLLLHLFVLGSAFLFDACPLPYASPRHHAAASFLGCDSWCLSGPPPLPEKGTRKVLYHDSLAAKGEPSWHLSVFLLWWHFPWHGIRGRRCPPEHDRPRCLSKHCRRGILAKTNCKEISLLNCVIPRITSAPKMHQMDYIAFSIKDP